MIIKVSPRAQKSQYSRLAKYISEPKKEGDERIEAVWNDNFEGNETDWEVASWKVDAQHKAKAEQKKDMTYHLIVSFTPEESEKLELDDFKKIGDKVAGKLGLGSHSRISAIHGDTKNKHMHIALNLLDEKNRFKEPYKAFVALKEVRKELEAEYGFEPPEKKSKDSKTNLTDANAKRENHSNLTSFEGWLKKNVAEELKKLINQEGSNWDDVHKLLNSKGVGLRKRGAGMVFSHKTEKLFIKASSVDRSFSFKKLCENLGNFKESKDLANKPQSSYETRSVGAKKLFEEYQKGLASLRDKRAGARKEAKDKFKESRDGISALIKKEKEGVMKEFADRRLRTAHLKSLTFKRSQLMEGAIEENGKRLKAIKDNFKHSTWIAFLQEKARGGDLAAIEALQRKGVDFQSPTKNQIGSDEWKSVGDTMRGLSCRVLGSGELVYETKDKAEIRDKGARLILGDELDDKTIEASLKLAVAKFGKTLHLNGSDEFRKAVEAKAEEMKLNVKFSEKEKTFAEKKAEFEKRARDRG